MGLPLKNAWKLQLAQNATAGMLTGVGCRTISLRVSSPQVGAGILWFCGPNSTATSQCGIPNVMTSHPTLWFHDSKWYHHPRDIELWDSESGAKFFNSEANFITEFAPKPYCHTMSPVWLHHFCIKLSCLYFHMWKYPHIPCQCDEIT